MNSSLRSRASFFVLLLAASVATAHAGILGWLTSDFCKWEQVERTGGIQLGTISHRDGKKLLPIGNNVCRFDSAKTVRKIEVQRTGSQIVVRIFTQLVESGRAPATEADLTGLPAGRYPVFYEIAADPRRLLGTIELP